MFGGIGSRFLLSFCFAALLSVSAFAEIDCPIEGSARSGGRPLPTAKVELNILKNRTVFPSALQAMTIDDVLGLPRQRNMDLEQRGVVLEGFLLGFKQEGEESPNCYEADLHDFHMWMGSQTASTAKARMSMRDESVVVEPTPRMQERHPSWTKENLRTIVGKRIRATGWLMFDPEHPEQIGKTRGTLWEVHPVMEIEVFQNGTWSEF